MYIKIIFIVIYLIPGLYFALDNFFVDYKYSTSKLNTICCLLEVIPFAFFYLPMFLIVLFLEKVMYKGF